MDLSSVFGIIVIGGIAYCAGFMQGKSTIEKRSSASGPQNRKNTSSDTSVEPPNKQPSASSPKMQGEEWFGRQMNKFSDDLMAYYIFLEARDKKLSAAKTMELYKRYGQISLQPSINEYEVGFREQGLTMTSLNQLAIRWLKSKGITGTENSWEQQITDFLTISNKRKADQIMKDINKTENDKL